MTAGGCETFCQFFFTSKMSKFTNFTEAFGELRAQKFRRKDRQICIWVDCKFE